MFYVAIRNLFQEKTRLAISIGGVAFSVVLMILLQGISVGYGNVLGQYFETVPTDLWVAKANTGNIMDPSFLPLSIGQQLTSIDGVASAKPFGMQGLSTTVNGKGLPFYVISYDAANNVGQPDRVSQGKSVPDKGEIIIDRIIAKSYKIKLGDSIPFSAQQLKVVGYSEGTYLLSSSFAFINKQDAASLFSLPDTTNYWLVQLKPGTDVQAAQTAISKQIPEAYAHTKGHFVQVNIDVVKDIVKPVFGALVVLGALIGTVVIGLTIFTSTIEKSKEYGILKAIGLKNRQLYLIVIEQALTAVFIGYAIGVALVFALNPLITNAVPQFLTQIRLIDLVWIFAVTILMALVASYIPMRRLSKIDPAEVFRA